MKKTLLLVPILLASMAFATETNSNENKTVKPVEIKVVGEDRGSKLKTIKKIAKELGKHIGLDLSAEGVKKGAEIVVEKVKEKIEDKKENPKPFPEHQSGWIRSAN
ncbi:MAG: hypothetical protein CR959_00350 [Fusobacteriales bacterium]|nr:MAG: hypothetical protein CR959_00350 [Fusobacteriales bacterium]